MTTRADVILLLSELGLGGADAVASFPVPAVIPAIVNAIQIAHGTAAVGLVSGVGSVVITAVAICKNSVKRTQIE